MTSKARKLRCGYCHDKIAAANKKNTTTNQHQQQQNISNQTTISTTNQQTLSVIIVFFIMALRAFHANPSIGGFGGESSRNINTLNLLRRPKKRSSSSTSVNNSRNTDTNDENNHTEYDDGDSGDAFCQIVKELVDNAVDAVAGSLEEDNQKPNKEELQIKRRIRVEIKPYNINNDNDDDNDKLLVVSVTDNGTGIENIKDCVNAFFSKKDTSNTSGRYGIGLTLCLIHAQRLVPNSYASITSTKKGWKHHKIAFFVVDTVGDTVVCDREETIPKTERSDSSGTCVRLLVPVSFVFNCYWRDHTWFILVLIDETNNRHIVGCWNQTILASFVRLFYTFSPLSYPSVWT